MLCNPLILAVLNGFLGEMRVLETYSATATAVLAQNMTKVAKKCLKIPLLNPGLSCKVLTMVNLDPTQKETKNIINTIQNQRHLNLSALTILISMKLKEFSKCISFSW